MCGRYSVGKDPVRVTTSRAESTFHLEQVFNAAPSQSLPVVLMEKGQLISHNMKWGFIRKGSELVINARSETLFHKFNEAVHQRRCLIPANGFYEWENTTHGKMPWRFCLKNGKSFCFAGLYQQFITDAHKQMELDVTDEPPKGSIDERFLIITGNPNPLVAKVHNRMPMILDPSHYGWWLDSERESALELHFPRSMGAIKPLKNDNEIFTLALQTYSEKGMDAYRVSQAVNNPRNNKADCFKPI